MRRPTWYLVAAIAASSLVTGVSAVAISLHAQAESDRRLAEQRRTSDRKFCELISAQDDAWSETTPATATGRRVAAAVHKLRRDLGCPTP